MQVDKRSPREAMENVLSATAAALDREKDKDKGTSSSDGGSKRAGPAMAAGGSSASQSNEPSAAEKAACDCVLATLLDRPAAAALYTHLMWQVGPRVGQWLLRTVGWVLEDRRAEHLTGAAPLSAVSVWSL